MHRAEELGVSLSHRQDGLHLRIVLQSPPGRRITILSGPSQVSRYGCAPRDFCSHRTMAFTSHPGGATHEISRLRHPDAALSRASGRVAGHLHAWPTPRSQARCRTRGPRLAPAARVNRRSLWLWRCSLQCFAIAIFIRQELASSAIHLLLRSLPRAGGHPG